MAGATTQVKILVPGDQSMVALLGQRDVFLKIIESAFDCRILVRGNEITVSGRQEEAEQVARIFEELLALLEKGHDLTDSSVDQTIALVKGDDAQPGDADIRPSEVLGDRLLTARGKGIAPRTMGQKRFVDAIRSNTVTFAIGPAGTGKTYLAVATAVKALQEHQVSRLILTRPAVEAGERLGYLPGTLYEKIDPYMRPLYDALFEMTGAETLPRLMERGTVEVAPLAFMRGRAQPVDRQVLTPQGFRPIGALVVGDLVVGSDGRPTPVLGVFPQGREEIFRLTTQDGASTLCSGEHLWAVSTAADRRRGRPRRVLETREMLDHLRAAHAHRFELPLVSEPVAFEPREVPLDPYALGLLLGDGCLTTSTTPSFSTADTELALSLQMALDGIELVRKGGTYDYVLKRAGGSRGGVIVANPVTTVLRELGLAGTRSNTKFVPDSYRCNSGGGSARGPAGAPRYRRWPRDPGTPELSGPVHDDITAAARRRPVPRAVTRRYRVCPNARGRGSTARTGEGTRGAVSLRCLRARHPAPCTPSAVPPHEEGGHLSGVRWRWPPDAVHRSASNRRAWRRPCASKSGPRIRCTSPTTSS